VFVCFAVAFIAVRYHEEIRARSGPGGNPVLAMAAGRVDSLRCLCSCSGLPSSLAPGVDGGRHKRLAELFMVNLLWLDLPQPNEIFARCWRPRCSRSALPSRPELTLSP